MIASTQTNAPFIGIERDLLVAKLKASGLRVTDARVILLSLLASSTQPLTIDQLFAQAGNKTCDLVTIYRSMATFEKAGVVYRSGFSDRGAALYKASINGERRYPVVCKDSSLIDELDDESSAEVRAAVEKIKSRLASRGYNDVEYIVEFFATAPNRQRA
jgi:Fur family transcriptional regulator, ferric uptake regulator